VLKLRINQVSDMRSGEEGALSRKREEGVVWRSEGGSKKEVTAGGARQTETPLK
jgi:hypothetical protein